MRFINGNVDCMKTYVADLTQVIKLYQAKLPEPHGELAELIEDIELDYVLEDLPNLVNSMEQGAKRIQDISRSLRVLARGDKREKVEAQLHESLDSAIMLLQHRLKANECRPTIAVEKHYGTLPFIQCYPGQLNQVLLHLLNNAIDALETYPESDKTICIRTDYIARNFDGSDAISISITDNGIGIPEDQQDKIFEMFFRASNQGNGSGLGLFIVKEVINQLNGSISFESTQDEGTTFRISLPRNQGLPQG